MERKKDRKGFTLIELLIVVAIIAILALIAVPNFLEAQTRAKISRVMADSRSLATGLEAYRVDWNCVPYWDSWAGASGGAGGRTTYNPGHMWWALTTPISYITTAFRDAFVAIGRRSQQHDVNDTDLLDPFLQVGNGYLGPDDAGAPRQYYCIVSYGPDGVDDTGPLGIYPYSASAIPYDPTNGTVSWGDIYRHSERPPTNFLMDQPEQGGGQGGFDPWWPLP
jgi:prepilin-type N-terminal cleavage/methylation domain-containing protein